MFYVLHRQRIEIAFTIRQMIDSIEHIGLADAVFANKAVYLAVKLEICFRKVFIIE
jgi:hypothetical protein